jgi:hypothetical protein
METTNPYAAPQELVGMPARPAAPTTFGGIFVTSVSLLVINAPAIVGVNLLVWLPFELLRAYYTYFVADPGDPFGSSFWLENLIGILPFAGVMAIGHAAMQGERPNMWFGLRTGMGAWLPMLGTRIVVGVLTLLALMAFVVPGFYVAARSILAEPALIAERVSGMPGMKRSFELTQGKFWLHFLLLLVVFGFMFLVGAAAQLPFTAFPTIDHWLITATTWLLVDVATSWPALLYVAAYWAAARPVRDELMMEEQIGEKGEN